MHKTIFISSQNDWVKLYSFFNSWKKCIYFLEQTLGKFGYPTSLPLSITTDFLCAHDIFSCRRIVLRFERCVWAAGTPKVPGVCVRRITPNSLTIIDAIFEKLCLATTGHRVATITKKLPSEGTKMNRLFNPIEG